MPMHLEADAFLDAIFDHPDDDTPRLVYADWLQEHGQENYAQFIRLQCAAAREKPGSDEANRLWVELGRVWNRLNGEWWPATRDEWYLPRIEWQWNAHTMSAAPVRPLRLRPLDAIHFHRGFLRPDIPFTADQAIRYSAFWPWIMTPDASLTIDGPPGTLTAFTSIPVLSHVRRIRFDTDWYDVNSDLSEEPLADFLRSPYLRRARILDLSGLWVSPAAIESLLSAENLSSVEEVRLSAPEAELTRLRDRFQRVNPD